VVKWYGRRIWDITKFTRPGENLIEVEITTSMGNYMKSLTDNPTAQYWTNEGQKDPAPAVYGHDRTGHLL